MTEVRKLKNRMKFGEPEAEYRDTGIGFGILGVGGIDSSLRVAINKNKKWCSTYIKKAFTKTWW